MKFHPGLVTYAILTNRGKRDPQSNHCGTFACLRPAGSPADHSLTSEMTNSLAAAHANQFPAVIAAMPRSQEKIASLISRRLSFGQRLARQVQEGLEIATASHPGKVMIEFGY